MYMHTNRRFAYNLISGINQNIQIIDYNAINKYQQTIQPYTHSNILYLDQINQTLNTQTHSFSKWNFMQTNPAQNMIIDIIRNVLNKLSGNNVPGLLSNVLTQNEMLQLEPINNMVQAMKFYVNNTANKGTENKQKMLQILSPHFAIETLQKFGFQFGKDSYYRSKKKYENQNNAVSFINKVSSGRTSKVKNKQIQKDIYDHCMQNSDIRHQQVMKRASIKFDRAIVARQLLMTKEMLWNCYSNVFKIGHTSFFEIVNYFDQFKYVRKRTDLCGVCEDSKVATKHINKCINLAKGQDASKVTKYVDLGTFDALENELKDSLKLSPHDRAVLINKIDFMRIYLVHLKDVTATKKAFIDMINNVCDKQCVITIDYKEKAKIGNKSDEESHVFRQLKLRNILGFAFDFKDERVYVGAVTNISNQTGMLSTALMQAVMQHPDIQQKFENYGIEKADFWFDRGSHFSNKVVLKWTSDNYPTHIMPNITDSNTHFHIGKHGKTHVDGIYGSFSNWTKDYATFHKKGIQSSADLCTALRWGADNRCKPEPNVSYLFINLDIDGPYKDNECFYDIKQALQKEDGHFISQLVLSQLKSFNHYFFSKSLQQQGMETEREVMDNDEKEIDILTLPSLKRQKTKNIDKILIRTKHLYSDENYVERWHRTRKVVATKPTIAAIPAKKVAKIQEIGRQQKARENMWEKAKLYEGNDIMIDIDLNMDESENKNGSRKEEQEALDYADMNETDNKQQKKPKTKPRAKKKKRKKEKSTKKKGTKKKGPKTKGKKPFKCNLCDRRFAGTKWLANHKRRVHNE